MSDFALFLSILGALEAAKELTRFIVWLDTPKGGRRNA